MVRARLHHVKTFVDSCIFLEIILDQQKSTEVEQIFNEQGSCSTLFVNTEVIHEVFFRIEEELERNKKEGKYSKFKITGEEDISRMRKDFYSRFCDLLKKCKLLHKRETHPFHEEFKKGISKGIRFDTICGSIDQENLLTAMTQEAVCFLTLDGAIIRAGGKIRGISRGNLNVITC